MKKIANLFKRGWCRCKALAIAFAIALGLCSASYAQESANGFDIDVVKDVADKLETTLENFWTQNQDAILAVIGIIVVLTLIWLVVKLFKRSTSKA
jgi:di/tricarboxylate transporter